MKSANHSFQSFLGESIERFLAHKRALGCRFAVEENALRLLDRYLVQQHVGSLEEITPALLTAFLASRPRQRARSYNHLRCTVARLFTWLVGQGLLARSPLLTRPKRETAPRKPFIFDRTDAGRLLSVAAALPDKPGAPLRGMTYRTIFALLYGLGLRVGEVSRLTVGDVDFQRRLLVIRETKFYKSRLAPFGPRIESLLKAFVQARGTAPLPAATPLFSFRQGRAIRPETISQTFHALMPQLELTIPPGTARPRLHDLRHSFAVGTLLRWYRSGVDPQAGLLRLATFLGHVDPVSTAVYLTIIDPLLDEANRRFEGFARDLIKEEVLP
jgi:integrase